MERGTVSMRVAFVLRSAEVQPLFPDLWDGTSMLVQYYDAVQCAWCPSRDPLPPSECMSACQ